MSPSLATWISKRAQEPVTEPCIPPRPTMCRVEGRTSSMQYFAASSFAMNCRPRCFRVKPLSLRTSLTTTGDSECPFADVHPTCVCTVQKHLYRRQDTLRLSLNPHSRHLKRASNRNRGVMIRLVGRQLCSPFSLLLIVTYYTPPLHTHSSASLQ